jgi:hypothetical protein
MPAADIIGCNQDAPGRKTNVPLSRVLLLPCIVPIKEGPGMLRFFGTNVCVRPAGVTFRVNKRDLRYHNVWLHHDLITT